MERSPKPKGTYADYLSGDYAHKHFVFELVKKNDASASMRSKETGKAVEFPLAKPIPLHGTISWKGPDGRVYPRKIRYAEGENEIFVDKQTPDDKFPKKTVYANFVKGRFYVDGTNTPLLDFLFASDINETNPNRDKKKFPKFRLQDTTVVAKKAMDVNKTKFAETNWCYNADWSEVEPLAYAIFTEELLVQGSEEIRYNLAMLAERDPIGFNKMRTDYKVTRRGIIKMALKRDILIIDSNINALCWEDNQAAPLNMAPPGKDVIEDFILKSLTTQGEQVFATIKNLLSPKPAVDEMYNMPTSQRPIYEAPIVKGPVDTEEELLTLVRAGVEKGIVTVSKTKLWWKFMDHSGKGEAGMVQQLRDNEMLLALLKKKVLETEVPATAE